MTLEEIKIHRLAAQHLLVPTDSQTVVRDLCGLQAQFLSHAFHGLSIRTQKVDIERLVKSWTNRGTMHLFSVDDLPLFLHKGRTHPLRPVDTLASDAYLSGGRKAYFADVILEAISNGIDSRDALKSVCEMAGMQESESRSLFDPWGGLIRALCETGRICHKVQEKKTYQLCPSFEPMEEDQARLELATRYFTHFGPATIKDAAYFFGTTQACVRTWLNKLPVADTVLGDTTYFYVEGTLADGYVPSCLFLAGFDQLMLGYEKTESLFLPREHIRDIFTRSGNVRPAVVVDGSVVGWWNLKKQKLSINLFSECETNMLADAAYRNWTDLKKIVFQSSED